jgi:hypothetical protein
LFYGRELPVRYLSVNFPSQHPNPSREGIFSKFCWCNTTMTSPSSSKPWCAFSNKILDSALSKEMEAWTFSPCPSSGFSAPVCLCLHLSSYYPLSCYVNALLQLIILMLSFLCSNYPVFFLSLIGPELSMHQGHWGSWAKEYPSSSHPISA